MGKVVAAGVLILLLVGVERVIGCNGQCWHSVYKASECDVYLSGCTAVTWYGEAAFARTGYLASWAECKTGSPEDYCIADVTYPLLCSRIYVYEYEYDCQNQQNPIGWRNAWHIAPYADWYWYDPC